MVLDGLTVNQPGLHNAEDYYSADNCLLHFETQLHDGPHNLTWHASPGMRVLISKFDVIKFVEGEAPDPRPNPGAPSTVGHQAARSKLATGAIAGIAVGSAAFVAAAIGAWLVFHSRRKQAKKTEDLKKQFQMTRRFSFPVEKKQDI